MQDIPSPAYCLVLSHIYVLKVKPSTFPTFLTITCKGKLRESNLVDLIGIVTAVGGLGKIAMNDVSH